MRADPLSAPRGMPRDPALDAARGLAVVAMVALHLVPTDGADIVGWKIWLAEPVLFVTGKCAALFCFAAGVVWGGRPTPWPTTLSRAAVLFACGVVFGRLCWPTEVLSALALMMVAVRALHRVPTGAVLLLVVALLTAVPIAREAWQPWIAQDWDEWGLVHRGTVGFEPRSMLRGWLYTGSYPLLPWLVFPLLGLVYARTAWIVDRDRRGWLALALPVAVAGQAWQWWSDARWEELELAPDWFVQWVPTTVPFVVQGASWSVLAVAGIRGLHDGLPSLRRALGGLADLGRASLSWYVLHVVLVFVPLRWFWPEEDWPFTVGLAAFALWFGLGVVLTSRWLRRFRRGPLEGLWARAALRPRR